MSKNINWGPACSGRTQSGVEAISAHITFERVTVPARLVTLVGWDLLSCLGWAHLRWDRLGRWREGAQVVQMMTLLRRDRFIRSTRSSPGQIKLYHAHMLCRDVFLCGDYFLSMMKIVLFRRWIFHTSLTIDKVFQVDRSTYHSIKTCFIWKDIKRIFVSFNMKWFKENFIFVTPFFYSKVWKWWTANGLSDNWSPKASSCGDGCLMVKS